MASASVPTPTSPYLSPNVSPYAQQGKTSLFFTRPWYAAGHEIVGRTPGKRYVNVAAGRARSGLVHATAWVTLVLLVAYPNPVWLTYSTLAVLLWDMAAATLCGFTPLSPFGVLGTLLSWGMPPMWKPVTPKRFAWALAVVMIAVEIVVVYFNIFPAAVAIISAFILLTWMELSLNFCLGCWMWDLMPWTEECKECKMDMPLVSVVTDAKPQLEALVRMHPLVIFSKTVCPHCLRAKELLHAIGAPYELRELDTMPEGDSWKVALVELTGQKTVPNIFIGGRSIGGADALTALHQNGSLIPMLHSAGVALSPAAEGGFAAVH